MEHLRLLTVPIYINKLYILLLTISLQLKLTAAIQCERISVPACQGLGYNLTAMPNLAGHETQKDADEMINQLLPILDSGCSKHARFLLCASIFPLCSPDVPKPVAVCKSLCEQVKSECSSDQILSMLWPKFVDCDQLPQPEKQQLCMQIPQHDVSTEKFVQTPYRLWFPWINQKLNKTTGTGTGLLCPQNFSARNNVCVADCGTEAMYTFGQKQITEKWTLALAAICFILTLFSLVTFWAEPRRFGYPERPVLFISLCYNLLSVCYLENAIFHHYPMGHNKVLDDESLKCILTGQCVTFYVTTGYLIICGAVWWLIFSICWYLSTEKQWSAEALEQKSIMFHTLAWLVPIIPPLLALFFDRIRNQELTGLCWAVGFVELPTIVLLVCGAIFLTLASNSLRSINKTIIDDIFIKRLNQVRRKILIFGCVFCIPATLAIISMFLEVVENSTHPHCSQTEPCPQPDKYSTLPTVFKLLFLLGGGSLSGVWVWSKKTCDAYRLRMTNGTGQPHYTVPIPTKYVPASVNMKKGHHKIGSATSPTPYPGYNFHNVPTTNVIL